MKPRERDLDLISVILSDSDTLASRLKRFDTDEKRFVDDHSEDAEIEYDAIMSPIYRIAEDALHLSDFVTSSIPDYPWDDIRGFRNFVAHGYREVDRTIAWKVATVHIPQLACVLRAYLENTNGANPTN